MIKKESSEINSNHYFGLSKKWGMLKVYNCIDFSVHPCIALSSDKFCIEKKLYMPMYWESYTWSVWFFL